MAERKNITPGDQLGSWTIIAEVPQERGKPRRVVCRCQCGRCKTLYLSSITSGQSEHCGCLGPKFAGFVAPGMKICTACKEPKHLSEFYSITGKGINSVKPKCIECCKKIRTAERVSG